MIKIEPIEIWNNGKAIKLDTLNAYIVHDNLKDSMTLYYELGYEEKIINVLAYLRASRAVRILQTIDMLNPGSAAKLLSFAEEQANLKTNKPIMYSSKLFLDRNLVFERMQLLSRIFSGPRVSLILSALEKL